MKYNNYRQYIHMEEMNGKLHFYLLESGKRTFLFLQRPYAGVRDFFKNDISLPRLMNSHKWGQHKMVDHVVKQLPRYLTYVQQYAA